MLGRWSIVYAYTAYPTRGGTAGASMMLKSQATRSVLAGATAGDPGSSLLLLMGWLGLALLPAVAAQAVVMGGTVQMKIPGMTGDTIGGMCVMTGGAGPRGGHGGGARELMR